MVVLGRGIEEKTIKVSIALTSSEVLIWVQQTFTQRQITFLYGFGLSLALVPLIQLAKR